MSGKCRQLLLRAFDVSNGGLASPQMKAFVRALAETDGPILGLDVGIRHIGVALSDVGRQISFSQGGFRRSGIREDIAKIRNMTHSADVHAAVVGMPSSSTSGGSYGKLQSFVSGYSQGVLAECGIKVIGYWDESFTTQLAKESFMKRSKKSVRNRLSLRKRSIDAVC